MCGGSPERMVGDEDAPEVVGPPLQWLASDGDLGRPGLLRLILCPPRRPPERLHRIVVCVKMLLVDAPGSGEWDDQRTAVHLPVVLVERADHRASVPPGPGRVVLGGRRLASDRVHRSCGRRIRAALARWLLAGLEPQSEIACLHPTSQVPGHLHREQKSVPRQQFVGVGPQRCRAGVVGEHVMQELGDGANADFHSRNRTPVSGAFAGGLGRWDALRSLRMAGLAMGEACGDGRRWAAFADGSDGLGCIDAANRGGRWMRWGDRSTREMA
jgi:hypothetical protein